MVFASCTKLFVICFAHAINEMERKQILRIVHTALSIRIVEASEAT